MDKFNNIQLELEVELEENNNETDDTANNAIQEIMNNFANVSNVQPFVNTYVEEQHMTYQEITYSLSTVKDLLKICNYYGLDKGVKLSKCKKQDIIDTIIYFETLPETAQMFQKRKRMWECMAEIMDDPKMKQYVLF
jgi:hypothetical protein